MNAKCVIIISYVEQNVKRALKLERATLYNPPHNLAISFRDFHCIISAPVRKGAGGRIDEDSLYTYRFVKRLKTRRRIDKGEIVVI